ncbi:hypothetical protein HDU76_004240, partial [Blyttiomyces sp. JEL0837]
MPYDFMALLSEKDESPHDWHPSPTPIAPKNTILSHREHRHTASVIWTAHQLQRLDTKDVKSGSQEWKFLSKEGNSGVRVFGGGGGAGEEEDDTQNAKQTKIVERLSETDLLLNKKPTGNGIKSLRSLLSPYLNKDQYVVQSHFFCGHGNMAVVLFTEVEEPVKRKSVSGRPHDDVGRDFGFSGWILRQEGNDVVVIYMEN